MKAGHCIGLIRDKAQIVWGREYQMMEEFMQEHNIESGQDIFILQTPEDAEQLAKTITKSLVLLFHGSLDPRLVAVCRNTSLFGNHGIAFGHFDGKLEISLMQYLANMKHPDHHGEEEVHDDDSHINQLEMENTFYDDGSDPIVKPDDIELSDIAKFMFAGKAIITVVNTETDNRFTYKLKKLKDKDIWFVSLLTGSNNEGDYTFIGTVFSDKSSYKHSRKSRITPEAKGVRAFNWFIHKYTQLPDQIKVYHNGYCGKCGRTLTVPESIQSGFGPHCAGMV